MTIKFVAALLCAAGLTSCASIVSGVSQPVSVETRSQGQSVAGVACKLSSNKGTWFVTTPGQVVLHRGYQDLAIECDKPGLTIATTRAASHVRPIFFGNLLFGGVIGIAVDIGDGAGFDYDDLISIDMTPAPTIGGMPTPISANPIAAPIVTAPIIASPVKPAASDAGPTTAVPAPAVPPAAAAPSATSVVSNEKPELQAALHEHRYQVSAERFAKAQSCNAMPIASLTTVGPGSETYTIPCGSAESLIVRCEFGACRALH